MLLPEGLRTRDPATAALVSVIVQAACAGVLAVAAVADPVNRTPAGQVVCWSVVAVLLAGVLACRRVPPAALDARGALLAIPVLGALAVHATNLVTHDHSAAAQVFLVMPVLLAAAKFRAPAAALVTGIAGVGNLGVTLVLSDPARALTDSLFTGAALVTLTVVLVRSQDRREELLRVVRRQADVDVVTGLATRRVLDDEVAHAVGLRAGAALVLVDVDHFKRINDDHGHPVGDAALAHLATVLGRAVRPADAVVGRLGGDELAVVLPGCPADVAAARAADLLDAVRAEPLALPDGTLLALSVSIGVAAVAGPGSDPRALYSAADSALYRAKRAGRDRLAVATS
ncbi:GGDEF domain-containing protein [Modestobacter sp. NPDC049651]|uniref:GGDEF domain-containing protein n=1 Tax=unclassified Modestobacter TaxID=2643866 RepID=UPI00340BEAD4